MKEEALKLADDFKDRVAWSHTDAVHWCISASAMIRRLVEELDCALDYIKQYQLQTKPTITKLDGKIVAVTMTDDEHRIAEVLWEAPKPLSDEDIINLWGEDFFDIENEYNVYDFIEFARAIEKEHGIK